MQDYSSIDKWDKYRVYMHYCIKIIYCNAYAKFNPHHVISFEQFEAKKLNEWVWKFKEEF